MAYTPHAFAVTDADRDPSDRDPAVLTFEPCHAAPDATPLVAVLDGNQERSVHLTPSMLAFLARELCRVLGVEAPPALDAVGDAVERTGATPTAAPDPRDALLRDAFWALLEPRGETRDAVALAISRYLLGGTAA